MTGKLDFIVFGTARSGTTALAEYLSASDKIHCASEVFRLNDDHSKLKMPDALIERGRAPRHPDQIVSWGHKRPIYYRRLSGVLNEINSRKAIASYRDPWSVAQSYTMRTLRPVEDNAGWPDGRTDLFAAGDLMMMAKAMCGVGNAEILVVPHKALSANWRKTVLHVASFIAPGVNISFDAQRVAALEAMKNEREGLSRPRLADAAKEAIEEVRRSGLPRVLDGDNPFLLGERREALTVACKKLPSDCVEFISGLAERHPHPSVRTYLKAWAKQPISSVSAQQ